MSMAACQAQCGKSLGRFPVTQCSSPIELSTKQPATVRFNRTLPKYAVHQMGHRLRNLRVVCAGAEGSGSCCGGSSSSGGGSCSSHGKNAPPPGVAGVGAEFENMVSRSTMQEFEKEYQTGQLQGLITRDIVLEVVNEIPELLNASNEERFVDVDAVLDEMTSLSNEDLVFDVEMEGTIV